jgi:hypothetical protein
MAAGMARYTELVYMREVTVEERTDGSGNEEKAPDLRYVLATVSARGLDGVPLAGPAYAHQGRPRAG